VDVTPEFIEADKPLPQPKRKSRPARLQPHPCANCARQVIAPSSRRIYCSDLCSQVASWIRYFQGVLTDCRLDDPEVSEAVGIKLAHIAGGGYAASARQISPELRLEIKERDGGVCRQCGSPGTDIDHISDSSDDRENLQLLCRPCHNAKTQLSLVAAEREVVQTVHRPIRFRALESPHRQPCDVVGWDYNLWIRGSVLVPTSLKSLWATWLAGPGLVPVSPATAVVGFPSDLDPWAWYLGDRPSGDGEQEGWLAHWPEGGIRVTIERLEDLDDEEASRRAATAEHNRKFWEDSNRRMAAAALRTITRRLPFRAPVSGKGKWHTTYADVGSTEVPDWVTEPDRVPACGSTTVKIDPSSDAFYPTVGEKRSQFMDRLCGNCIRIQ
jgi:hypothetical protein